MKLGSLNAFSDSAGHDGGSGSCKHGLENEVTVASHCKAYASVAKGVVDVALTEGAADTKPAVEVARVVSVEADKAVSDDADCDDEAVFEQDVHRVLSSA